MMRVNKFAMPVVVIVALLGTVLTAKAFGYWQTSGREMIDPTQPFTSGDIRGWMPLEYLMERMDLGQDELYALLGLPADTPPSTPLKDLESIVEVSEVRWIIAEHLGETPSETEAHEEKETPTPAPTATPVPTVEHGQGRGQGSGSGGGEGAGPTPLPAGQILPAAEIRGRMTLQEVSDQCGVPLETIYAELGLAEDLAPGTVLRDLAGQVEGFEVQRVRDVVAAHQGQ